MRREQSSSSSSINSLSPSSAPLGASSSSSSSSGCDYRKLNLLAFAGTFVYIGYLVGCAAENGNIVNNSSSSSSFGNGPPGDESVDDGGWRGRRLRAFFSSQSSSSAAAASVSSSWDHISESSKNKAKETENEKETTTRSSLDLHDAKKTREESSRPVMYATGPVIHDHKGPVTSINLLGERHSGTNWITNHLVDCFGDQIPVENEFTRFKHWFQFDDPTVRNDSALVIAMFRDPYDWVEAMHEQPHHAHGHIDLNWKEFVTKPWVGPRGPEDEAKIARAKAEGFHIEKWGCLEGYKFDEVVPCSSGDSVDLEGYGKYMYELKHDESHRAYGSVIELRTAKIRNFLQVPEFHGVRAFFPERYEALSLRGTADLLKQVEEVTGLKANCRPFEGAGVVKHKDVDPEYTRWMNKYHDWNVEAMIGYVKRNPVPCR